MIEEPPSPQTVREQLALRVLQLLAVNDPPTVGVTDLRRALHCAINPLVSVVNELIAGGALERVMHGRKSTGVRLTERGRELLAEEELS